MTVSPGGLLLSRPPVTKDELWAVVHAMWGVKIPRKAICDNHQAPFDAFADAYFAVAPNWALWYGSRGTGKSYLLALLALTKASLMGINVTLLGGSMAQSQNVHEHIEDLMGRPRAPMHAINKMIQTELEFFEGNWIRPLPASQKTVRGPHPHMTLLDEIDEMEKAIYDAAQGQAMKKPNTLGVDTPEMTVASSTWQHPSGTFEAVLNEARKKGLPVFTWCYREVQKPHGWMDPDFIERKRKTVPAEMFRVEYELGEPSGGSRAFDLSKLNEYFIRFETVNEIHKGDEDEWVFAKPVPGAVYAAGADWAKEHDKTVIVVLRIDETPWRPVYYKRINRRPWPVMIEEFNRRIKEYQAFGAHDATGLGNVVHDLIDERTLKVVMVGKDRTNLLTEYITAVENGKYRLPRNTDAYEAHRGTTVDEIFNPGKWNSHLSDDVAAFAIAHRAATRNAPAIAGEGIPRTETTPAWLKAIDTPANTDENSVSFDGVVTVAEENSDVGVFWLT